MSNTDSALSEWLATHLGLQGVVPGPRLGGGNSNVTQLLDYRDGRLVLRRPPDAALSASAADGDPFDIVFCDPPFPLIEARESRRGVLDAVARIARANLAPEGVIVLHVPARALLEHEFAADLSTHERVYGAQSIWFVQPTPQEPPPDGR
jgi:16S rRNA G966 N2-methylase RsmD